MWLALFMWIFSTVVLAIGVFSCLEAEPLPIGFTRGSLLSIEAGSLAVRRADGVVYDCGYDGHIFFQRDRWPIQAGQLSAGESVEVLSDRRAGTHACYTRMLSVVYAVAGRSAPVPRREPLPLHGSVTLAGLVTREDGSSFTVKTRGGERTLRLRADTSYSQNGLRLAERAPLINQHVFIRGGRGTNGALEAYQIMWGQILTGPVR